MQQLSESQLKNIRRREYYQRRVKANFAPQTLDEMIAMQEEKLAASLDA